ncbi:phosphoribosylglycinamide formyltransferase [Phaffia rhodozyma]|uniref:Phosphoribosylglycinamide formyltransferase n=1 Tax=Phaffia rhodozyma TaxID=264483 RepID=A0A0F7SH95_PHARH|nr:phosphoribosylglycinamide formyltransferase [Phaffia rhodozyma]
MSSSSSPARITVLISGSGSNLQALLDASLPVTYVISNRSKAYGLTRAANHNPPIPSSTFNLKTYLNANPTHSRKEYDAELSRRVEATKPDLIVLAGFMHILSPTFLNPLAKIPIINLHPALPGAFDGADAIGRAYAAFQKGEIERTGVMVHRVVEQVDQGEPLLVRQVEIFKDQSLDQLEEKMHKVEHGIIVEGVKVVLAELGKI